MLIVIVIIIIFYYFRILSSEAADGREQDISIRITGLNTYRILRVQIRTAQVVWLSASEGDCTVDQLENPAAMGWEISAVILPGG
jgi:hypothetical protein